METDVKKYMVIETFNPDKLKELYLRLETKGRMFPKGVRYIDSWINENLSGCYQLMESDSIENLELWTAQWSDLVDFEIIPIIDSETAMHLVLDR